MYVSILFCATVFAFPNRKIWSFTGINHSIFPKSTQIYATDKTAETSLLNLIVLIWQQQQK